MTQYELIALSSFLRDIEQALDWSEEHFGRDAADRYQRLIRLAYRELETNPRPLGHRQAHPDYPHVLALHLRHFSGQVKRPRHLVIYAVDDTRRMITFYRLLHEAMDQDLALSKLTLPPLPDDSP